jgi:hypothetical protein
MPSRFPLARIATLVMLLLALAPGLARGAESVLLARLMPDYDAARTALAGDRLGQLAGPAHALQREIAALGTGSLTAQQAGVDDAHLGAVRELLPALRHAAQALVSAGSLAAARTAFGDLSKGLIAWRELAAAGPAVAYCPMVGKSWLQPGETPIENPYGGKAMTGCGSIDTPASH